MTLQEILAFAIDEYSGRNQLTPEQALLYANEIQRMAYDKDLVAFLEYRSFLVVNPASPLGPYQLPVEPPCRKFVGLTTQDIPAIVGSANFSSVRSDYGFGNATTTGPRNIYEPLDVNVMDRQYSFLSPPDTNANIYRIVYYRRAPVMESAGDNAHLIIPSEHHFSMLVNGICALADFSLYGERTPLQVLLPYLQPFWDTMTQAYDAGNRDTLISDGQPG